MPPSDLSAVLRYFRRFSPAGSGVADALLLQRFVETRDEAAFAALVERHGPLVWSACKRLLSHADAEDAFQAVFLVLVRRAGAIRRPELLGAWLHGVAYRVAAKVRSRASSRAAQPLPDEIPVRDQAAKDVDWRDLRPVLDEEINRLPERQRVPFVLFHIQGLSSEEVAQRLGCPSGTVKSRLARAREKLRYRLTRRGIGLSSAALGTTLSSNVLALEVPPALCSATIRLGLAFSAGLTANALGGAAVGLATGVLHTMFLTKLQIAAVLLLATGFIGIGGGWLSHRIAAQAPTPDGKPTAAAPAKPLNSPLPGKKDGEPEPPPSQNANDARGQTVPSAHLGQKMKKTLEFSGIDDPKVTFQEGLDLLGQGGQPPRNIAFRVNEKAFKFENVMDVLKTPIADPNPIPKMKTSFANVLEWILSRIPAPSGAVFLIRKDFIEITTGQFACGELGIEGATLGPLVYEDFHDQSWSEAVRVIADRDMVSLVVDPQVATKVKELQITAQFHNTPVETAARILAEMAELGLTRLDNVLYITSREKAARLAKEENAAAEQAAANVTPRKKLGRPQILAPPGGGGM